MEMFVRAVVEGVKHTVSVTAGDFIKVAPGRYETIFVPIVKSGLSFKAYWTVETVPSLECIVCNGDMSSESQDVIKAEITISIPELSVYKQFPIHTFYFGTFLEVLHSVKISHDFDLTDLSFASDHPGWISYIGNIKTICKEDPPITGAQGSARMLPGGIWAPLHCLIEGQTKGIFSAEAIQLREEAIFTWLFTQGKRGHHFYVADSKEELGFINPLEKSFMVAWDGGVQGEKYSEKNPYTSHDPQHFTQTQLYELKKYYTGRLAEECHRNLLQAMRSDKNILDATYIIKNQRQFGWPLTEAVYEDETLDIAKAQADASIGIDPVSSIGYPSLAPKKKDHGECEVCIWQTGTMLLGALKKVEEGHSGWVTLAGFYLECILNWGRAVGVNADDINETIGPPETFWNDYSIDGRVNKPASYFNGTSAWLCRTLLLANKHLPNTVHSKDAYDLAKKLYFGSDAARVNDKNFNGLEVYGAEVFNEWGLRFI